MWMEKDEVEEREGPAVGSEMILEPEPEPTGNTRMRLAMEGLSGKRVSMMLCGLVWHSGATGLCSG